MGVDQLVTGGDFDDPVVDSLTSDSVNTDDASITDARTRHGYDDVSGSRSFDTWYQNTTDSDLDVIATASVSANDTRVFLILDVSDSQSQNAAMRKANTLQEFDEMPVSGTVPDEYYYQIRALGDVGSYSLNQWREQE